MHSYDSSRDVGGSTMTSLRTTGVKFGVLGSCSVASKAVAFVGPCFLFFGHEQDDEGLLRTSFPFFFVVVFVVKHHRSMMEG